MKQILCNKYEVLKPVAEGGMGIVYLVRDLHLNKLAAVKVSKNPSSQQERETVLKEMEVLKGLSHPALPGIIDFFEEGGNICLVMEYVEGITLEQYLRKFTRVELSKAVRWAVELTEVLGYLHKQNPPVIYRDLKPANIMIQPDGKLKLVDFGAAFVMAYGQERHQLMMGTPGYSAPEQWHSGNAGKGSDIYGVGAVLHEMLTGISPGNLFHERRPVREYDKSIPKELEKVIIVCTKKRAFERYSSMEQLKNALLSYGKKEKNKEIGCAVRKGVGALLLIAAAGRTVLPFLKGVPENDLPFPYMEWPGILWGAVIIYRLIFLQKKTGKKILRKQEKSVFLTEKKSPGIYVAVFLAVLLLTGLFLGGEGSFFVKAKEPPEKLWVEMRDEYDRKLLLKEEAVYCAGERIRFEIPTERMPEGESALWLTAEGEEGTIYRSRIFLIEKEEEPY